MSTRTIAFVAEPTVAEEAPGVFIRRTIGGERLIMLDPFFLFDHATVDPDAHTDVIGFPRHPHRGIQTLSVVFRGEVAHRDSIGNEGVVGPGGSQAMTAGNGIFHEEMMHPGDDGAEFLQLWFNLPRAQKRAAPSYQRVPADEVRPVLGARGEVRVIAGETMGQRGPVTGIAVDPIVLDVRLHEGGEILLPAPLGWTAVAFPVEGVLEVAGRAVEGPALAIFSDGDGVVASGPGRFLFAAAAPLNEPVAQYRSFVMNTPEEIGETLAMIEAGRFGS